MRLVAQGIADPLTDPTAVIRRLTCTQSQELTQSLWSIRLRTATGTEADLRVAYDAGEMLRTHVLRPTWHTVDPTDLRWLIELTGPRVLPKLASMLRGLGIESGQVDRARDVIVDEVGTGPRTRTELSRALAAHGFEVSNGIVVGNLIMAAELELAICSGPMRGKQPTYVIFDERCPARPSPDRPAVELLRRCVIGHGPMSLRDVSRWSGLTLTQVRQAHRDADDLETVAIDGTDVVHHPATTHAALGVPSTDRVLVLPEYDELTLSFRDLPWTWLGAAPTSVPTTMINRNPGLIMVGDRVVGYWARYLTDRRLSVTTAAPSVDPVALDAELAAMARFYDVELDR